MADGRAEQRARETLDGGHHEAWLAAFDGAYSHVPLSLYDEHQKPAERAVEEMLGEIERLARDVLALHEQLEGALSELHFPEPPKPGDGRAMRGSAVEWKDAAIGWRRRAVHAERVAATLRQALEELVKAAGDEVARKVGSDPERSGAEYWATMEADHPVPVVARRGAIARAVIAGRAALAAAGEETALRGGDGAVTAT